MKSSNSARTGMVPASKVPESVCNLLQTIFSNSDRVFCSQERSDQNAMFTFTTQDDINILLAIQGGNQQKDILYANGRAYIDMGKFVELQLEHSELLAACVKKQPCKMVVMKGGKA